MIPHLAATLIWAGFSLSPGAIEVVFTTRAGRLRTWVGGDLAPLWAHSIEWLVWWSTLFPIQWPGPICPLVSEATGRTGEPGVPGDFWGSQEGCQGPSRPSGREYPHRDPG